MTTLLFCLAIYCLLSLISVLLNVFFSNIQAIKAYSSKLNGLSQKKRTVINRISVVIPAYNESKVVYRTVKSIMNNSYGNFQVIIVNDGSTDNTAIDLYELKKRYPKLIVVNQKNSGKSVALNNALFNYVNGDIMLVLDADSIASTDALAQVNLTFQNEKIIALSSNIRILHPKKFLEWAQFFEYLFSSHNRGSQVPLNMQYIIGGAGSAFRVPFLKMVGGYDINTPTEDIALSLKMINYFGNKDWVFGYSANAIFYTMPVHYYQELIVQRLRWRYGQIYALIKYKTMMFNHSGKYTFLFSFFRLPLSAFGLIGILTGPFLTFTSVFALLSLDYYLFLGITLLFTFTLLFTLANEPKISISDKLKLICFSPALCVLLSVTSFIEFIALILSFKKIKQAVKYGKADSGWNHVSR